MTKELFAVTIGSRAFGLESADSDYDVRSIVAKTASDLYSPFPENEGEAGTEAWGSMGAVVQVQALDYGSYLRQLVNNDLNAWLILMSDMNERGYRAHFELRELAVRHLLDSEKLLSVARRRAVAMVNEAQLKGSGKIAANGLAHLRFALNMGREDVLFGACDLGTEDAAILREIKFNPRMIDVQFVLEEMLSRELSVVRHPDPEPSYANAKFMEFYHWYVE